MFTIKFLLVFIGALFIIETKQNSIISAVHDCMNLMCDNSYTLDFQTCSCIHTEIGSNSGNGARNRRSSDKLLVSKLIRDDEFVMQASSDRCRNDEQWNGSDCVPLISLCPGGYHWDGHACIIQVVTKTAALVPSRPDTTCALNAKIIKQTIDSDSQQLPATVMPTYSTSPMCPFGFIWLDEKCIRNPPTCPSRYYFRDNLCHLMLSPSPSPTNIVRTTELPSFQRDTLNENKWTTKPTAMQIKENLEHEIENSSGEMNADNDHSRRHQHCCMIMSPRICRHERIARSRNDKWQCYHHQYHRCGDFCTKPILFLRPKKTIHIEPLLIMPPPPRRLQKLMLNLAYRETNIDCSGCLNGGYGCSSDCFAYDCNAANCEFIDEDLLCGTSASHDDDNSDVNNDDYEINLYADICAYSTS